MTARLCAQAGRSFWQVPAANIYPADVYAEKLRSAGFENISIQSIQDRVVAPFCAFAQRRMREDVVRKRMNGFVRLFWMASFTDTGFSDGDYVLVSADKPARDQLDLVSPDVEMRPLRNV